VGSRGGRRRFGIVRLQRFINGSVLGAAFAIVDLAPIRVQAGQLHLKIQRAIGFQQHRVVCSADQALALQTFCRVALRHSGEWLEEWLQEYQDARERPFPWGDTTILQLKE